MQRFSGCLCEVAADENGRTSGLFQEWVLTHLLFGRELFYYMQFLSYEIYIYNLEVMLYMSSSNMLSLNVLFIL